MSLCECVVKRTGKVCARPTTGFNSQKTPVCGMHIGRPRRRILVNTPPSLPKKKMLRQATLKPFIVVNKKSLYTDTTKWGPFLLSILSWIVVLTTLMIVNPPPQKMVEIF